MTNFLIKYTSCQWKIAWETDLEIKFPKNTQTSLRIFVHLCIFVKLEL